VLIRGREFPRFTPAYWAAPEFKKSLGGVASALAADSGVPFDPWQQLAVHLALAVKPQPTPGDLQRAAGWDFVWASPDVLLIIARQLGKGYTIEVIEALHLFLLPTRRIMHTAHLQGTAHDAMARLIDFIDRSPKLARHMKANSIRRSNGSESISVRSIDGRPPSTVIFRTRTDDGMRGIFGELLVCDEAYALTQDQLAAVLPTQRVQPNRQTIFTSSAGLEASTVLNEYLAEAKEAHANNNFSDTTSMVWCALPPRDDKGIRLRDSAGKPLPVDLDSRVEFERANPSDRVPWDQANTKLLRKKLGDERYAREYLSVIPEADEFSSLALKVWNSCADPNARRSGDLVLSVEASPGSRCASVVAAGQTADGRRLIEVVAHRKGVDWVPDFVARIQKLKSPLRVVLDPTGPAGVVQSGLKKAGVAAYLLRVGDMTTATARLLEDVRAGKIVHLGDDYLEVAVAHGVLRTTGDGVVKWTRAKSSVDICTLVGATLSNFVLDQLTYEGGASQIW
jgi:hypothetical protein